MGRMLMPKVRFGDMGFENSEQQVLYAQIIFPRARHKILRNGIFSRPSWSFDRTFYSQQLVTHLVQQHKAIEDGNLCPVLDSDSAIAPTGLAKCAKSRIEDLYHLAQILSCHRISIVGFAPSS
jgi:hypothetical protein